MDDFATQQNIVARMHGFESWSELSQIISSINLTVNGNLQKFEQWKKYDGTKTGLIEKGLLEGKSDESH